MSKTQPKCTTSTKNTSSNTENQRESRNMRGYPPKRHPKFTGDIMIFDTRPDLVEPRLYVSFIEIFQKARRPVHWSLRGACLWSVSLVWKRLQNELTIFWTFLDPEVSVKSSDAMKEIEGNPVQSGASHACLTKPWISSDTPSIVKQFKPSVLWGTTVASRHSRHGPTGQDGFFKRRI